MKKIIHIDMDAFYTSVEMLDNPFLKGKEVAVGGLPEKRGVIATANYNARKYGVRSAMASVLALKKCPQLILRPPRFHRYKELSHNVYSILRRYSSIIETVALDEAWIDVTAITSPTHSATHIGKEIQEKIRQELHLSCSIGVSYNKFLAKLACEEKKPAGFFVIKPQQAHQYLMQINIKRFSGIGRATEKKLHSLNIYTSRQLHQKEQSFLQEHFGKFGLTLYQRIRGVDTREIQNFSQRKSISDEYTFDKDISFSQQLFRQVYKQIEKNFNVLEQHNFFVKTLTIKIKFYNFQIVTRGITHPFCFTIETAWSNAQFLLQEINSEFPYKKIRLIGIRFSNFRKNGYYMKHIPFL